MSGLVFRKGVEADKHAVMSVVAAAFRVPTGSDRWYHLAEGFTARGRTWRVAERDGELVAALRVSRDVLRVGEGHVVKGDVGEVAVKPEAQGQGIATALLRDTVAWMRDSQFDFSRLGGLVRFYSRFGYVPFVRRYVEFYLRAGVGAGAATIAPSYLNAPARNHVFPLATDQQRQHCHETATGWNGWRAGALLESRAPSRGNDVLLYREGDNVLAWVQLAEFPTDRTEFESRLTMLPALTSSKNPPLGPASLLWPRPRAFTREREIQGERWILLVPSACLRPREGR